jgi:hypothetical protein
MFKIIFTLDYEIHGNGDGQPKDLLITPTNRILALFNKYDAKLTILADIAEILKFKEYKDNTGQDKFHYNKVVEQLQSAIKTGHDVQLHIHSSYMKSEYRNGKWEQCWDEYNLAKLPYKRIFEIIHICKSFLEQVLRDVKPDYKCNVFRAANWSMIPSANIVKALINNGIGIDTSVYKYGTSTGRVVYDYSDAYSDVLPWYVANDNVCKKDPDGKLLEVPIYCERRYFISFITFIRLFRMIRAKLHKHKKTASSKTQDGNTINSMSKFRKIFELFLNKHPWKLDFNQATGRQLIKAVKRIEKKYDKSDIDLPIVLIGHSKSFIRYNNKTLKTFLEYCKNNESIEFSVFNDIEMSKKEAVL